MQALSSKSKESWGLFGKSSRNLARTAGLPRGACSVSWLPQLIKSVVSEITVTYNWDAFWEWNAGGQLLAKSSYYYAGRWINVHTQPILHPQGHLGVRLSYSLEWLLSLIWILPLPWTVLAGLRPDSLNPACLYIGGIILTYFMGLFVRRTTRSYRWRALNAWKGQVLLVKLP